MRGPGFFVPAMQSTTIARIFPNDYYKLPAIVFFHSISPSFSDYYAKKCLY